jgi:hypothetical protein
MSDQVPVQGSETRRQLLPVVNVSNTSKSDITHVDGFTDSGLGFFGSPYSPADAMLTPPQIGVQVGNSMESVVNAIKGVGFYTDQIGFGAPSTAFTRGMPLKPLGVNYFIKTGQTCSNGADMWHYMNGIPEGDALGENMKRVMEEMGMPPLKGLAPGMLEDVKHALNPSPLINAMFGSGYPQCKQVTLPVGDAYGRIADKNTQESWITDPKTARWNGSSYVQTRWVQDTDRKGNPIGLDREAWARAPRTFNADGTPKKQEGFDMLTRPSTMIVVGALCVIAFAVMRRR